MNPQELQAEIKRRGLRQVDVAEKMGVHESTLARVFNGRRDWPEGASAEMCEQAIRDVAQEQARRLLDEPVEEIAA